MAVTKSRKDDELTDLLTKLYTIQEDIGAKPKTTEDEKKAKAENVATMGSSKKAQKKGSRFLELKSTVLDRLKTIHQLLKDTKTKEAAGYGGDNAKDIIKMQAEIREHIRQAGDEWTEMDAIYKKEARKKKSKFTLEELEVQSELVRRLQAEIEKVKEAQMRGYARGQGDSTAAALNSQTLYSDSGELLLLRIVRLHTMWKLHVPRFGFLTLFFNFFQLFFQFPLLNQVVAVVVASLRGHPLAREVGEEEAAAPP